jgi:hypothetical protein
MQVRLTLPDFGRLASACLREAASGKVGAYLSGPTKIAFFTKLFDYV